MPTQGYTLALHDALPISLLLRGLDRNLQRGVVFLQKSSVRRTPAAAAAAARAGAAAALGAVLDDSRQRPVRVDAEQFRLGGPARALDDDGRAHRNAVVAGEDQLLGARVHPGVGAALPGRRHPGQLLVLPALRRRIDVAVARDEQRVVGK